LNNINLVHQSQEGFRQGPELILITRRSHLDHLRKDIVIYIIIPDVKSKVVDLRPQANLLLTEFAFKGQFHSSDFGIRILPNLLSAPEIT